MYVYIYGIAQLGCCLSPGLRQEGRGGKVMDLALLWNE